MREINTIVVHCAATTPDMDVGAAEIREWHLQKGWSDVGYHYIIRRSGEIEKGRPVEKAGAHVKGHNEDTIGVCLVGGLNSQHNADFNFTFEQMFMLYELINDLRDKHGRGIKVAGHRDFPNVHKACPCFDVSAFFENADYSL